jgi:hypothetical protein
MSSAVAGAAQDQIERRRINGSSIILTSSPNGYFACREACRLVFSHRHTDARSRVARKFRKDIAVRDKAAIGLGRQW